MRSLTLPRDASEGEYVYICYLTYKNETIMSSELFSVVEGDNTPTEKPSEIPIYLILIIAGIVMLFAIIRIFIKSSTSKN
jgi:hypothetical protein